MSRVRTTLLDDAVRLSGAPSAPKTKAPSKFQVTSPGKERLASSKSGSARGPLTSTCGSGAAYYGRAAGPRFRTVRLADRLRRLRCLNDTSATATGGAGSSFSVNGHGSSFQVQRTEYPRQQYPDV